MRVRSFVIAGCGLCLLALGSPSQATQTYSSQAAFLANVQPGFYMETFEGFGSGLQEFPNGTAFSGNGFTFTASSNPQSFKEILINHGTNTTVYMSTSAEDAQPLTLTFSSNVTAVGGNFYRTDLGFDATLGTVSVTLADGTHVNLSSTTGPPFPFVGFTAGGFNPIVSLTMSTLDFNTIDNIIIGQETAAGAAPEPSALALLLPGVAGIAAIVRRKRMSR